MLRHEISTSIIRIYTDDDAEWGSPYVAVLTLLWETPTIVEIIGFHGEMTHKLNLEILQFFLDKGIETVKASRHGGHKLPGAILKEDGFYHLDIKRLAQRKKLT